MTCPRQVRVLPFDLAGRFFPSLETLIAPSSHLGTQWLGRGHHLPFQCQPGSRGFSLPERASSRFSIHEPPGIDSLRSSTFVFAHKTRNPILTGVVLIPVVAPFRSLSRHSSLFYQRRLGERNLNCQSTLTQQTTSPFCSVLGSLASALFLLSPLFLTIPPSSSLPKKTNRSPAHQTPSPSSLDPSRIYIFHADDFASSLAPRRPLHELGSCFYLRFRIFRAVLSLN